MDREPSPQVACQFRTMAENPPVELSKAQIALLQKLLQSGFEFVQLVHVVRYLPVQKNRFVALLDPSSGKLGIFGQAGYRMDEGVGILVEREGGRAFVWKSQSVEATPALVEAFEQFKKELNDLLVGPAQ